MIAPGNPKPKEKVYTQEKEAKMLNFYCSLQKSYVVWNMRVRRMYSIVFWILFLISKSFR
jgi:hypothetical protein